VPDTDKGKRNLQKRYKPTEKDTSQAKKIQAKVEKIQAICKRYKLRVKGTKQGQSQGQIEKRNKSMGDYNRKRNKPIGKLKVFWK